MRKQEIRVLPRTSPLRGTFVVPGDKSITHRALFFAGLRDGKTIIHNPSPAHDCRNTLALLRKIGCSCEERDGEWIVDGSTRSIPSEELRLDCGNSGTTARLATGFLTGERGTFLLEGDSSLSRRPMERVAEPLRRLGAQLATTKGSLPLSVIAKSVVPDISDQSEEEEGGGTAIDVTSAQVHAALTLAGLRSRAGVQLRRVTPMRDHTLRIAKKFGWEIETTGNVDRIIPLHHIKEHALEKRDEEPLELRVPGDVSSAAFLVAAALLLPGSDIHIEGVGLNPSRIGFLETVAAMGGEIAWRSENEEWEPLGTIGVRYTPDLRGIHIHRTALVPPSAMIDELPLLALLGAMAEGETRVGDARELRVKESDRVAATVSLMASLGVKVSELEDGFIVGGGRVMQGGRSVDPSGDHRLAMMAGIAGLIAEKPVTIKESEVVGVSWPGFWKTIGVELSDRDTVLPHGSGNR